MGLWVNINWQYNATYIQYKDCSKAHYLHDFLRQLLRRKDPSLTSTSGRRQKPANKEANGTSKLWWYSYKTYKCTSQQLQVWFTYEYLWKNFPMKYIWAPNFWSNTFQQLSLLKKKPLVLKDDNGQCMKLPSTCRFIAENIEANGGSWIAMFD